MLHLNLIWKHINWCHDLSCGKMINLWSVYSVADQMLIKLLSNCNFDFANFCNILSYEGIDVKCEKIKPTKVILDSCKHYTKGLV